MQHLKPQRAVESDGSWHFVGPQCDRTDPLDHGRNSPVLFLAPFVVGTFFSPNKAECVTHRLTAASWIDWIRNIRNGQSRFMGQATRRAARIASTTSPARAKSWGLSRKQTRRREPAPSPLIVQTQRVTGASGGSFRAGLQLTGALPVAIAASGSISSRPPRKERTAQETTPTHPSCRPRCP